MTICIICDTVFTPKRNLKQKTCSPECRKKYKLWLFRQRNNGKLRRCKQCGKPVPKSRQYCSICRPHQKWWLGYSELQNENDRSKYGRKHDIHELDKWRKEREEIDEKLKNYRP